MKMTEIRKLETLLKPHLTPGQTIINYDIRRLTAPGEHYGSMVLSVTVQVNNQNNEEETLNLVAKKIPDNEWLQTVFNVQGTFVKEMKFYDIVIPTLIDFQLEQGMKKTMDFFPAYFGGRINLNPGSDKVDEDGALLLENLKLDGYVTAHRLSPYDYDTAEFAIRDLAVFHAVPLALRLLKPEVFEKKVMENIKFVRMFGFGDKEVENGLVKRFVSIAASNEETAHLVERVREGTLRGFEAYGTQYDGLFGTVIHSDYWTSNIMQKYEDGRAVANKILDFQIVNYGPIGVDVLFFLFSSIQLPVLEKHFDTLLRVYYDSFIDTLKQLKCDVTPFTYEAFLVELEESAWTREFLHAMMMLNPILRSPHVVKEMKDTTPENFMSEEVPQRQKEKGWFIIKEFARRNWI